MVRKLFLITATAAALLVSPAAFAGTAMDTAMVTDTAWSRSLECGTRHGTATGMEHVMTDTGTPRITIGGMATAAGTVAAGGVTASAHVGA